MRVSRPTPGPLISYQSSLPATCQKQQPACFQISWSAHLSETCDTGGHTQLLDAPPFSGLPGLPRPPLPVSSGLVACNTTHLLATPKCVQRSFSSQLHTCVSSSLPDLSAWKADRHPQGCIPELNSYPTSPPETSFISDKASSALRLLGAKLGVAWTSFPSTSYIRLGRLCNHPVS
ncbi:unnamed protein product [Rangifer tarandus platyrhynchus]|uniref:Uncharacterized protein n=1 Tax=Rangifer tarandus platyrhynchus TaxID=3082113 RepID=A0AC59ZU16_RANTA